MNLEELVEILKAWNIATGNTNLVALLNEEKTIEEYVDQVISSDEEWLEKMQKELESLKDDQEVDHPLSIPYTENTIKRVTARLERIWEYKDKYIEGN